jgi:hypothetical protein
MVHCDTNFVIQATVTGSPAHAQFAAWAAAGEAARISYPSSGTVWFWLDCSMAALARQAGASRPRKGLVRPKC